MVDDLNFKEKMNKEESLENFRIITEILTNNELGLEIYKDDEKLKEYLSNYDTLTFGTDLYQLINFNTTKEIYDYIHKNSVSLNDSFSWGISYQKFQEYIGSMVTDAMKNTKVTQWLFILTNVFRTCYLNDNQMTNNQIIPQLPSKTVKVQNQTITGKYRDVSKDYKKVTSKQKQKLADIEQEQLALTTEYSRTDDELHENEKQIEEVDDKKTAGFNKNKIEKLKAENEKLNLELKILQDAYDKAKAEFDTYDEEYQMHNNKAEKYKKLIKT